MGPPKGQGWTGAQGIWRFLVTFFFGGGLELATFCDGTAGDTAFYHCTTSPAVVDVLVVFEVK